MDFGSLATALGKASSLPVQLRQNRDDRLPWALTASTVSMRLDPHGDSGTVLHFSVEGAWLAMV